MSSTEDPFSPWRVLETRLIFDRRPWLTLWEEDVELPSGAIINGYLREVGRDYAMVFAVLPDGTVPLVRQYKQGIAGPSYDLPAGYLDSSDEPPLQAAKRELREETGLTAETWQPLSHAVVDSNRGDTRAHLFLALGAQPEGAQELDPSEALVVSFHTPADLREMITSGMINSLASVAAIMMALDSLRGEEPSQPAGDPVGGVGHRAQR
jgi:8-oxo-dGTP pyrophosphatase MutT (NUDIX family)